MRKLAEPQEWSKGRDELKDAFGKGDAKFISSVGDAFKMSQRDGHKIANFSRSAHEDHKRLYNLGRKLFDLKPI